MAIDFDALRKKLNNLSGKNSRRNSMWRPEEGETATIRIIAFPNNDGQPFKERWFYYGIGNNPGLLTPHQFGKPDPIQDLINNLREEGAAGKKESYELAKQLYPKMRTYAAVIVRGEEDKGPRIWSFGKTVYQDLLNIMLDEDYGDITDPLEGFDIKIEAEKPPGRKWVMTSVRPRRQSTPLSEDPKQVQQWMKDIPDLDDLYTLKSHDELEKIVNDWLNFEAGGDVDDDDVGTDSGSRGSSGSSDNKPSASFSDIDEAFKDLEAL